MFFHARKPMNNIDFNFIYDKIKIAGKRLLAISFLVLIFGVSANIAVYVLRLIPSWILVFVGSGLFIYLLFRED
jgi:hypothetical protein